MRKFKDALNFVHFTYLCETIYLKKITRNYETSSNSCSLRGDARLKCGCEQSKRHFLAYLSVSMETVSRKKGRIPS